MATEFRISEGEISEQPPPVSAGHVHEVRREWLVRTDEQFARRVQEEEIVLHLTDNRHRNVQIREDFPTASAVQAKTDSIAQMEEQIRQKLVEDDAKLARKLQVAYESKESRKSSKVPKNMTNAPVSHNPETSKNTVPGDMRDSRVSSNKASRSERRISSNGHQKQSDVNKKSKSSTRYADQIPAVLDDSSKELDELGRVLGEPSNILKKEKERLIQEEEDAEIARRLEKGNEDIEHRDRLSAQILQEKEYARYRKSEEAHRLRQKHKNKSQSLSNNVTLSDTYSIPHDILQGSTSNDPSRNVNDSHYMIPIEEMKRHALGASVNLAKETPYLNQQPSNRTHQHQNSLNRIDGYNEDPHYMEVLADSPVETHSANGIYKGHRAPPQTPQHTGRPKLAEPTAIPSNFVATDSLAGEKKYNEKSQEKSRSRKKDDRVRRKWFCCF